MSTHSPRINIRPSPKRRMGTPSPHSKKKRPTPKSAEKAARPRRRLGVSGDSSHHRGKKRQQKGGKSMASSNIEEFNGDLERLINWLKSAIEQADQWKAPSNNTLSIRVQLEKYLAFAMEVQTRQHLKDSVALWGQDLAQQYPHLRTQLQSTINLITTQYQRLEERLDSQYGQLEEALSTLETSTRSDSKNCRSFDTELIMDCVEQMSCRLQNSKRRNSPMEISIKAMNQQVDTFNTSNKLSSTGGSDSSCSSSPDFDVLYEELSDWLSELHMAVTDSQQGQSNQRMEQMLKGYTQELHLREVTRSKLNRKANRLLAHRPSTSADVTTKLQSINQQWDILQTRLLAQSPSKPANLKAAPFPQDPKQVFMSSEEVMTVTLEVEEVIVQLKSWLTDMERKLFATDSVKVPGSVEQMEKRLEAHKELQADIAKNSEGIQVVLNMCEILQRDKLACANEKEKESLQLAAFNLERRWQAIQAQAMALQCSLEEKLRTFKGTTPESSAHVLGTIPFDKAATENDGKKDVSSVPKIKRFPYQPSGAKDDSALYTIDNGINYDDILLVREAFSENDAFSISDASEVSLGDFAFDDVLPLKGEDEDSLSIPPHTPDILEMSDDMIDAYLKMEEDQLMMEEVEIDCCVLPEVAEIRDRSNSELEFWSMSPREEPTVSNSIDLPHTMPSLEDLDQKPVHLQNKNTRAKSQVKSHSVAHAKYSTRRVDPMTSVVEDALESLCSDDDYGYEDDVHEADDEGEDDVDLTITEERCQGKVYHEPPRRDDDFLDSLVFDLEDVAEPEVVSSPPSKPRKLSRSLPVTRPSLHGDIPTYDYSASYPCHPTWSHPSVTIAKSPQGKRGFFPSHTECFLPNLFENVATSSPVKEVRPIKTDAKAEFRKFQRRLSQVSNPLSDKEEKHQSKVVTPPPQDNLLEITDLNLSHMYESLDLVTELTNSLMPGTAQPVQDEAESPWEFPLLEKMEDSDSDSESFSDSSENIEREELVQSWINENMPTPPEIIPLQMPPELPFSPLCNLDSTIHEIPTHDLPSSLPSCSPEVVCIKEKTSDTLCSPTSHSETGIAKVQETHDFLESLSLEQEATLGHCTDAVTLEMADEEVDLGPSQQEVMNQYQVETATHKHSDEQLVLDCNDGTDTATKQPSHDPSDFSAIKKRLKREIMEKPYQKQAYFTYVSQLAEKCGDDAELAQILGEFNHQKCYLWSIGGSPDQPKEPATDSQDVPDALTNGWMEAVSQCSDDTDKLLEASNSLVEELEKGSHLQDKQLPEKEIGSWRDVIVLWLNDQHSTSSSEDVTDGCHAIANHCNDVSESNNVKDGLKTPGDITANDESRERVNISANKISELSEAEEADIGIVPDCSLPDIHVGDEIHENGSIMTPQSPAAELIDSGNFSADFSLHDESLTFSTQESLSSMVHLSSTPKAPASLCNGRVMIDSTLSPCPPGTKDVSVGNYHPTRTMPHPRNDPSNTRRVLCLGLPLSIFLFLCILFVILLPAVIVSTTGDCSLSLIDNILLHSPSWEPLLHYVRGPPPQ